MRGHHRLHSSRLLVSVGDEQEKPSRTGLAARRARLRPLRNRDVPPATAPRNGLADIERLAHGTAAPHERRDRRGAAHQHEHGEVARNRVELAMWAYETRRVR